MLLTVAVIGAPHGLRGEVRLDVRTDAPERRLSDGAVLVTDPAGAGPLTVTGSRQIKGAWHVTFAEVPDRTAAETLRGVRLVVDSDADDPDDDEGWYPHELIGLRVEHLDGRVLGAVADLEHGPAQDLLVVAEPDGTHSRVPFVPEIVPLVDPDAGRILLDPPRGLLAGDPADPDDDAGEPGSDTRG